LDADRRLDVTDFGRLSDVPAVEANAPAAGDVVRQGEVNIAVIRRQQDQQVSLSWRIRSKQHAEAFQSGQRPVRSLHVATNWVQPANIRLPALAGRALEKSVAPQLGPAAPEREQ
jgi:hypothetical protein